MVVVLGAVSLQERMLYSREGTCCGAANAARRDERSGRANEKGKVLVLEVMLFHNECQRVLAPGRCWLYRRVRPQLCYDLPGA